MHALRTPLLAIAAVISMAGCMDVRPAIASCNDPPPRVISDERCPHCGEGPRAFLSFDHNAPHPNAAGMRYLDDSVASLTRWSDVRFKVSGHADRSERDAALLARRRAAFVHRVLGEANIEPTRIVSVEAHGATRPLTFDSNCIDRHGAERTGVNRRVELDVVN